MAAELKDLIKTEPRQTAIDQFCQTGCGEAGRVFMQITVKAPHIGKSSGVESDGTQPPSNALDLRVCPKCFNKFFHALAQAGADLNSLVQR